MLEFPFQNECILAWAEKEGAMLQFRIVDRATAKKCLKSFTNCGFIELPRFNSTPGCEAFAPIVLMTAEFTERIDLDDHGEVIAWQFSRRDDLSVKGDVQG